MSVIRKWRGALVVVPFIVTFSACSSGTRAPDTIEGKTPSEYREDAEKSIVGAVPAAPKGAAPKGGAPKAR